jgi:hypothetical protein
MALIKLLGKTKLEGKTIFDVVSEQIQWILSGGIWKDNETWKDEQIWQD